MPELYPSVNPLPSGRPPRDKQRRVGVPEGAVSQTLYERRRFQETFKRATKKG